MGNVAKHLFWTIYCGRNTDFEINKISPYTYKILQVYLAAGWWDTYWKGWVCEM